MYPAFIMSPAASVNTTDIGLNKSHSSTVHALLSTLYRGECCAQFTPTTTTLIPLYPIHAMLVSTATMFGHVKPYTAQIKIKCGSIIDIFLSMRPKMCSCIDYFVYNLWTSSQIDH